MFRTSFVGAVMATTLLLASTFTGVVVAQTESGEGGDVAEIAARVNHRGYVRVLLASGEIGELRAPAVRGTRLAGVDPSSGNRVEYSVGEIERIWGRGSAAGTGFLVGAALGGVTGAIGGVALAGMCIMGSCSPPSTGTQVEAAVMGGLLGGMTVGVAGLLIAAPIHKWSTVYRIQGAAVRPVVTSNGVGLTVEF